MDQIPKTSRDLESRIMIDLQKIINNRTVITEEDTETINMINNENDKTVTNIKYFDIFNLSKMDESNKNDLKNFFEIEDEDSNPSHNFNKLDCNFIALYKPFSFLCKFCKFSIGSQNLLHFESKFIELTNEEDIFNVSRKDYDQEYSLHHCLICEGIVGFHIKRENKSFLIHEMIKIQKEKEIKIGIFSLKEEYIKRFQNYIINLDQMYKLRNKHNHEYKLVFKPYKMTKEFLNKNYKNLKDEEIDCAYIIHKNEGRLFLLGRNGYYNKLIEDLFPKLCNIKIIIDGKVAIILVNNFNTDADEIIDKLILKGDQKSLQLFQNENKFFFINDDTFNNIVLDENFPTLNLLFCYQQISYIEKNCYLIERKTHLKKIENAIDSNDRFLLKQEGPKINEDLDSKIKSFVQNYENIKNGKSNKLCFML